LLLILFSFFSSHKINFEHIWLYLSLLPNIAFVLQKEVDWLGHFWSLGVEEHFYLFWPIIISRIKNLPKTLVGIIITILLLKGISRGIQLTNGNSLPYLFFYVNRFDCMIIGALGAYFFRNQKLKELLQHPALFSIAGLVIILCLFNTFHIFSIIDHEIISIITIILIFNLFRLNTILPRFLKQFLNWSGELSFGIYVFHPLIIIVCSLLLKNQVFTSSTTKILTIYLMIPLFTLIISYISYSYFERPFNSFRNKFRKIETTTSDLELKKVDLS